jgi:hypothetical protein
MREDPDLSREDAVALLQKNIADYAGLIQWVRALNVPGDGGAGNPGQAPADNGALAADSEKTSAADGSTQNAAQAVDAALGTMSTDRAQQASGNGFNGNPNTARA